MLPLVAGSFHDDGSSGSILSGIKTGLARSAETGRCGSGDDATCRNFDQIKRLVFGQIGIEPATVVDDNHVADASHDYIED